jgi:hypothetical protein
MDISMDWGYNELVTVIIRKGQADANREVTGHVVRDKSVIVSFSISRKIALP